MQRMSLLLVSYILKIDGQWSLYIINNGSGHYRPTQASTLAVVDVVKKYCQNRKLIRYRFMSVIVLSR